MPSQTLRLLLSCCGGWLLCGIIGIGWVAWNAKHAPIGEEIPGVGLVYLDRPAEQPKRRLTRREVGIYVKVFVTTLLPRLVYWMIVIVLALWGSSLVIRWIDGWAK